MTLSSVASSGLSELQLAGVKSVLQAPWEAERCDACDGEVMLLLERPDWDVTLVVSGEDGGLRLQRLRDDLLEPASRHFPDLAALVAAIRSETALSCQPPRSCRTSDAKPARLMLAVAGAGGW